MLDKELFFCTFGLCRFISSRAEAIVVARISFLEDALKTVTSDGVSNVAVMSLRADSRGPIFDREPRRRCDLLRLGGGVFVS